MILWVTIVSLISFLVGMIMGKLLTYDSILDSQRKGSPYNFTYGNKTYDLTCKVKDDKEKEKT